MMTYSISVLYYKSGGKSGTGQLALIVGTGLIFVFGMVSMPYIPRCMAGTLLLHIGIDLFLEGVYESYAEYDAIEYGGVSIYIFIHVLVKGSSNYQNLDYDTTFTFPSKLITFICVLACSTVNKQTNHDQIVAITLVMTSMGMTPALVSSNP